MLELLKKDYPFLKKLDEEALNQIQKHLNGRQFKAGEMLINGSQACWGFSFILSGKLRVYRLNEEGREVTLYRLEKGDSCFMTVICALAKSQTYAYVKVEEDCELAIIPMPSFDKYLMNHPTYLQFLFQNLYGKFTSVVTTLEQISFSSVEERVLGYLKQNSHKQSGRVTFYKTHEQIAFDIGTSREVVSRTLKAMERKGLIQLERGKIVVLEMESIL